MTTTRCRLPLPIGTPEQKQITVTITDLRDYLHGNGPSPEPDSPMPGIEIWLGQEGYYPKARFLGRRADTSLIEAYGSTTRLPSLSVAVAHLILGSYSAEYLGLDGGLTTGWNELKRSRSPLPNEPTEVWQQRSEAERGAIVEAEEAWDVARAERAHTILDVAICELTGSGIDEHLATGRPFDPESGRYLDGAREYSDGSTADDAP